VINVHRFFAVPSLDAEGRALVEPSIQAEPCYSQVLTTACKSGFTAGSGLLASAKKGIFAGRFGRHHHHS
jgi:hypothetical protein